MSEEIVARANAILLGKGYSQIQLAAYTTAMPTKALLKGSKIQAPFSDSPEIVLRACEELVPALEALGRKVLTPHQLRAGLSS